MLCADCKYLKSSDKKNGAGGGAVYYCSKHEKYVNGATAGCENISKSYERRNYEADDIICDGRNYCDCAINPGMHFIILIIILIFGIILKIFV